MPTRSITLTADTVATVNVPGEWNMVAVMVPDAEAPTVHVSLTDTDPAPWADDTFAVPGATRRRLPFGKRTGNAVKLISTGTPRVEVEFA